jgi:hypothetical protein
VVEHLPSKLKALNSTPRTPQNKITRLKTGWAYRYAEQFTSKYGPKRIKDFQIQI